MDMIQTLKRILESLLLPANMIAGIMIINTPCAVIAAYGVFVLLDMCAETEH